jgi:endonuclease YncB( thermonuclease family)
MIQKLLVSTLLAISQPQLAVTLVSPLVPVSPKNIPIQIPLTVPAKSKPVQKVRSLKSALVIQVIDGDTIKVSIDGVIVKVRFGCIDAPETKQPLGKESTVLLTSLILNKTVQISTKGDVDMYGRLIGSVYLDDVSVSPVLVKSGLALFNSSYAKSCPDLPDIIAAENAARSAKLG